MVTTGDDLVITIDSTDRSTLINEYSESGGDRVYVIKKMMGNTYKRIETGRTNYELTFNFKMESTTLNDLYEITTPITITVAGTDFTITYYQMLPMGLELKSEIDGISEGQLKYIAPAYDKANTRYNRVIS